MKRKMVAGGRARAEAGAPATKPCPSCGLEARVIDAAPEGEQGDVLFCPICDGTTATARLVRSLRERGRKVETSPSGNPASVDGVRVEAVECERGNVSVLVVSVAGLSLSLGQPLIPEAPDALAAFIARVAFRIEGAVEGCRPS